MKKFLGSQEFIRDYNRYCLWIDDDNLALALSIPFIANRIEKVKKHREQSVRPDTIKSARYSHKFTYISHQNTPSIIIPRVSSEAREYIPIGFLTKD